MRAIVVFKRERDKCIYKVATTLTCDGLFFGEAGYNCSKAIGVDEGLLRALFFPIYICAANECSGE